MLQNTQIDMDRMHLHCAAGYEKNSPRVGCRGRATGWATTDPASSITVNLGSGEFHHLCLPTGLQVNQWWCGFFFFLKIFLNTRETEVLVRPCNQGDNITCDDLKLCTWPTTLLCAQPPSSEQWSQTYCALGFLLNQLEKSQPKCTALILNYVIFHASNPYPECVCVWW